MGKDKYRSNEAVWSSLYSIQFPIRIKETGEIVKTPSGYYRTRHWRMIKKAFKKTHACKCKICGQKKYLCLHHLTYIRFTKESLNDLVYLCRNCHYEIHLILRKKKRASQPITGQLALKLLKKKSLLKRFCNFAFKIY